MKVLIISHNPLCTYDAMGITFLSLFSGFKPEEICQLYIYPSIPNVEKCSSYLRITDKSILKSYYRFRVRCELIQPVLTIHSMFERTSDESLYRNPKNKRPLRMLLRDLMWKLSNWYNKELKDWIKEEKPDCIFAAPGSAIFLYDIVMRISKDYSIPIVSYLCDEYYFTNQYSCFLKKTIEKYMASVSRVISISEELTNLYSKRFKVAVDTIMTGTSFSIENCLHNNNNGVISFLGNVRCNRFHSLIEVGKALDVINHSSGTHYQIRIYTAEKNIEILEALKSIPTIDVVGFVSGSDFINVIHNSEYLLHVEAFDKSSIEDVRNSVSTKIADSLGSGVPLIAYGPDCVASIKHLKRNKCAIVITEKFNLISTLSNAFSDCNIKETVVTNAIKTAKQYHSSELNTNRVRTCISNVIKDG